MAAKKKVNVSKLARQNGLEPTLVHNRLALGWTLAKALGTPVRKHKAKTRKKPVAPLVTPPAPPTPTPVVEKVSRLCKPCMAASITGCIIVFLLAYWYLNA